MRVLLVQPHVSPNYFGVSDQIARLEPLNLEYLAAGIKDFNDVHILDMRFDKDLGKSIDEFRPDVVGITGFATHCSIMKEILGKVKAKKTNIFTVAGGIFVTSYPEYFTGTDADILVIGEGVFPLRDILQALERKRDLKDIPGLAIQEGGHLHYTAHRPHPPLDTLPFPDRSLTSQYRNDYFMPIFKPVALLRTSLGCAFRCNFCLQHKLSGGRYLTREVRLVVEELKEIKESNLTLADDETFLQSERVSFLADLIKQEGIKKQYHAFIRADTLVNHRDVVEKWMDIGLSHVLIGFESFKDDDLKLYNKKSSVSTNERAIGILNDLRLDYTADFIIRPDYDKNDFKQLRAYVRQMKIRNPSFPVLTPYPGTDLFWEFKDSLLTHDYQLYDQNHLVLQPKIPMKTFYRNLAKIRKCSAPHMSWKNVFDKLKRMSIKELLKAMHGRIQAIKRIGQMKKLYRDISDRT